MRASGILMHISSLPSKYGIGTMGEEAFHFIDFLKGAGQKLWQILPVTQTSYGDSPYQSFSTFAGNPYFIDLDFLCKEKLLKKSEYENIDWGDDEKAVDYGKLYFNRYTVLKKAYLRFAEEKTQDYLDFIKKNKFWLEDYSFFMALKFEHNGLSWQEWETELKRRVPSVMKKKKAELAEDIDFWRFVQFKFFAQFSALKAYANKNNVKIIGDIPIYVALDSADVWANPSLFLLDENLAPIDVSGCPPDYFSKTGQLWGNPLYRWDLMKENNYDWWVKRIIGAGKVYDIVRIDHFRGFESYYAIPGDAENAIKGEWRKGPDIELFDILKQHKHVPKIIAEDLGLITKPVHELLEKTRFPGMKVLQFAFNARQDNIYLPHNFDKNCVCYVGTHDNDTTIGWLSSLNKKDFQYLLDYLNIEKSNDEKVMAEAVSNALTRLCIASSANTAIVTMQDLLLLDTSARMNRPSVAQGYWRWRVTKADFPKEKQKQLQKQLLFLTKLYHR